MITLPVPALVGLILIASWFSGWVAARIVLHRAEIRVQVHCVHDKEKKVN